MPIGISFSRHVSTQALPKLKDESDKEMFTWMASVMEEIGTEGYTMYPKEIIAWMEHHETKDADKYSERNWLDFLSYLPVAKYMEAQNIKGHRIKLRRKIDDIANKDAPSQSDIKIIDTLRAIVSEADAKSDNMVQTYTTFTPPRSNYHTEQTEEEKLDMSEELKNIILTLGLDSDYMGLMNTELDVKKQKEEQAKLANLKMSVTDREKVARLDAIRAEERAKAKSKFDELKERVSGE